MAAGVLVVSLATLPEAEMRIEKIQAREILDSRGWPTVEVDVHVGGGIVARAAAKLTSFEMATRPGLLERA
jgi:hypothetical protein